MARHVLLGEFNESGRPAGFHHAPGGVPPAGRRIDAIVERYPDGTYRAHVSFFDADRGWVRKGGLHMMFPDDWTSLDVVAAGLTAYKGHGEDRPGRWSGDARGIRITGAHKRGRPKTFYPVLGPERQR